MKIMIPVALALLLVGCGDDTTKKEVKQEVTKKVEKPKEVVKKVEAPKKKVVVAKTGESLFAKCSACHGASGEKKALNKSLKIGGWDIQKLESAMNGYKNGTRNIHGMGGVMKSQVSSFSKEDIKMVSKYISNL